MRSIAYTPQTATGPNRSTPVPLITRVGRDIRPATSPRCRSGHVRLGYRSIVLQGHSLGTVQVAFYAATDWDPTIKAVILTGAFGKLPWKSRHILIQDEGKYKALAAASRRALKAGTAAELLPIKMRWIGGIGAPVTPQHFPTYRDDQASAADGTYWIPRIPRPILIVRDEADGIVQPFEPYMLLSAAQAEGSLVPSRAITTGPIRSKDGRPM